MTVSHDPILEALVERFGDNAGFALELLSRHRLDPGSVGENWRRIFEELGERGLAAQAPATQEMTASAETTAPASVQAPPPSPAPSSAAVAFTPSASDERIPLIGGAATIARNMESSLSVPTATSQRVMPVKVMEENRRILNRHREVLGQSKISFTHFVAWAIVRALDKHRGMNDAYAEDAGKPVRLRRAHVNLGIAVDVPRRDGSRTLLVPNIKSAETLSFATFLQAFDTLVAKARKGSIEPDAFVGTTISLTNPGTVGTTASAPRLMPGQGTIIATGAMGYPAEFQAMPDHVMAAMGVARVMSVSSTYDHRIIQGAESGMFLATLQELLLSAEGFYEGIFSDLKVPHRPVAWEKDTSPPVVSSGRNLETIEKQARVLQLINAYRVRGHLVADLDPLGVDEVPHHPDLDPSTYGFTVWDLDRKFITNGLAGTDRATLREILEVLRQTYCGKIGAEFMFIQDPTQKKWLIDRMEETRNRASLSPTEKLRILGFLVEAESFEKYLHAKYVGHKRFSLEGGESAIPLLGRALDRAAAAGIEEAVLGMPHRGRLTVLANIVRKPVSRIFAEFEDVPEAHATQGSGDVKYHLGAVGTHRAPDGRTIRIALAPNPSHLEFVNPVVEGMVRAKQDRLGDARRERVLPVLFHGDAAFAGQGIVAETFNLSQLEGYRTGGTFHVVVNNQIGFTTNPADARSSPYCTDVAKMVQSPVFHVNGDDPEAVVQVVDLALDFRNTFQKDVVIDMVCYRRYGHNEGDEPSYTQPLLYQKIKAKTPIARIYSQALVRDGVAASEVEGLFAAAREALDAAYDESRRPAPAPFVDSLIAPSAPRIVSSFSARDRLLKVIDAVSRVPEGFEIHPKLRPLLARRADFAKKPEIDWAGAEMLAFGMLLQEGIPVRLAGQDSGRGTFSHRHAVLNDCRTGQELVPLNRLGVAQARFEVIDSLLSENATMGFEFGYAVADPSTLVLWEGQFGDFANGAQVIIDQFISGSEQKWNQVCGLVLLLPHGQEGQGPEHSSARLERFLTLCAENNLRVANVSTPAQYYRLLVRQMSGGGLKPLVLMAPKSLLRHPRATSPLEEFLSTEFQPVLDDAAFAGPEALDVQRVVLASGKVLYELLAAREKMTPGEAATSRVAILRLEELHPFPTAELSRILSRYPKEAELVFVQEEPRNMGAWRFVREQFLDGRIPGIGPERPLRYVGRRELASPAPGSHSVFQKEQEALVAETLRLAADAPAS